MAAQPGTSQHTTIPTIDRLRNFITNSNPNAHSQQKCEAPNSPRFLFTGFGPFLNVADNPSRKVAYLVRHNLSRAMSPTAEIPVFELEVTKDCVVRFFEDVVAAFEEDSNLGKTHAGGGTIFLIHFGVHRSASHIHIERRGLNCAHYFPGPDASGFMCQNMPILVDSNSIAFNGEGLFFSSSIGKKLWEGVGGRLASSDSDADSVLEGYLETPLSLDWIDRACYEINSVTNPDSEERATPAPVQIRPSHNAGRYLCNTTLLCSLAVSSALNRQARTGGPAVGSGSSHPRFVSLFIHVMNEDALSIDHQAALITTFLGKLASSHGPECASMYTPID